MKKIVLILSTCFGLGKIPLAPGTFGSIFGLILFFALLSFKSLPVLLFGTFFCLIASIYFCDVSEKILNEKDPSEVILDEIVAVPVCYLSWIILIFYKTNQIPGIDFFLSRKNLLLFLGIFITFRLLDAFKPFPINQIQKLPGGFGIVADDLLAGVLTSVTWTVILIKYGL